MSERWAEVPDTPGWLASTEGRLLSVTRKDRPVFLAMCIDKDGYARVGKGRLVHHLIAAAHLPPRRPGQVIRHLNGNSLDNRLTNLTWGTQSENELDKVRHGTHHEAAKAACIHGHEFTPENTLVERNQRVCVTCRRTRRSCPECGEVVLRSNLARHRRTHR